MTKSTKNYAPALSPPAKKRLEKLTVQRKSVPEALKKAPRWTVVDIDEKEVERLASIDCTAYEIAAHFDIAIATLYDKYKEALEAGRAKGNYSLKAKLYEVAMGGNVNALIFLAKNRMYNAEGERYRDKLPDQVANNTINIMIAEIPK